MNETVKLFNNEERPKSECVKIKQKWYKKGRDCFRYKERWFRNESPSVAIDHATGEYFLKRLMSFGIIRFNSSNRPVFGYFKYSKKNILREIKLPFQKDYLKNRNFRKYIENNIESEITLKILNEDTIPKELFREKYSDGIFYNISDGRNSRFFTSKGLPPGIQQTFNYEAKYTLSEVIDHYRNITKRKSLDFYDPKLLEFFDQIKGYTYGFEFETTTGFLHRKLCSDNGLIPLRDGSIGGIEFATIPMSFPEDLALLKKQTDLLIERTVISSRDSTHVHIGGFPLSKKSIYALYITCRAIEKEMYSIVPEGFKDTSFYKRRSYNNSLPILNTTLEKSLDENFEIFYNYLSGGALNFKDFTPREHPRDERGNSKWYVQERYSWVNFISLLFGTKRTVEFRSHTCTLNYQKLIYWLFVCTAILKYADKNKSDLVTKSHRTFKLNFYDMFNSVYSKDLTNILMKYVNRRKKEFYEAAQREDIIGQEDVEKDVVWKLDSEIVKDV